MHAKSTAGHPAGTSAVDLVLERLPSGELAWLRPADDLDTAIADAERLEQDLAAFVERCDDALDPRYVPTERGRDYLARLRAWAWLGVAPAEVAV